MKKRGKIAIQVLVILIVIVLTSAVMLVLVKSGVLGVKDSSDEVLDTEFIPYGKGGSLAIKDFKFCGFVDDSYNCIGEGNKFALGDAVYFTFIVDSSTYDGDIKLVENYRVKDPNGKVVLEVDTKNDFYVNWKTNKASEKITFKDYFTIGTEDSAGKYTFELLISNSLLGKNAKLVKEFEMK